MKKLIIMLHGVGSNGADLAPIAEIWQQYLPDLTYASPNAPFAFMHSHDAFEWFSLNNITPQNRNARIKSARPAFDHLLGQILDEHGMRDQLKHVVLCGFSQGTMMALDALVSGRWPVAGVIGLSGRLASEIESIEPEAKIILMHGNADSVIPISEAIKADQELKSAGYAVQFYRFKSLTHAVNEQEIKLGIDFLRNLFSS